VREAAVAFSAGLLSFATPCVLPLVPAYLGAIGARSTDPRRALQASIPFVLGFSVIFIALGAGAGLAGGALTDHRAQLIKLSGIVIVAMGLVMLGLIPVPALNRTLAPGLGRAHASGSAMLLGAAFGLAWTPCIGPVLGSIIALAATGATAARGAALLAAYAAGLAVPFLVAGVALGRVMSTARFVRDRYTLVQAVSGAVLIAAGLLVFFDKTYLVNAWVGQFTS
jgi:cytochrome c-type biogenesis protein